MRTTPHLCLVFVALLCGSAALSSAQNLLQNGTFDSGISPWTPSRSQTVATFSTLDADGNAGSGSIRATAPFSSGVLRNGLLSECIPVVPGATYQRSYDYRIEPLDGTEVIVYAQINWHDDAGCGPNWSGEGHFEGDQADGDWHSSPDPGAPFTAPAGAWGARLALYISLSKPGGSATVHFDNVVFKALGSCAPADDVLCLNDGRFQVSANWRTADASGRAHVVQLTNDTGYLWFFDPDNVEVVVKVLDACEPFGRFWVFAGGLTNVEVDLTVTDTQDEGRRTNTYRNQLNEPFAPLQDTDAFATCEGPAPD